jgi:hypothetical protein
MAKVRMKTLDAGPNGVRQIGQVYDVDDKEAKELVEGGFAEYVEKSNEKKTSGKQGKNVKGGEKDDSQANNTAE